MQNGAKPIGCHGGEARRHAPLWLWRRCHNLSENSAAVAVHPPPRDPDVRNAWRYCGDTAECGFHLGAGVSMRLEFHTLDVFTDQRFGGNSLAVVLAADALDTPVMQSIAREFNLSETVFVLPPDNR
ncbi:MAG: PhzF family phenazine biosynthesis protein, partial [Caldilineaceae bacterium]|nr:PhzF family phenazine biosynthesis protein [Caldilineaceae bacterium]